MALLNTVVSHILTHYTEAATLDTWLNQSITVLDVLDGLGVLVNGIASRVGAFEFQILEVLLDVSMNSSEINLPMPLAFFRAVTVILSPRIDTVVAE